MRAPTPLQLFLVTLALAVAIGLVAALAFGAFRHEPHPDPVRGNLGALLALAVFQYSFVVIAALAVCARWLFWPAARHLAWHIAAGACVAIGAAALLIGASLVFPFGQKDRGQGSAAPDDAIKWVRHEFQVGAEGYEMLLPDGAQLTTAAREAVIALAPAARDNPTISLIQAKQPLANHPDNVRLATGARLRYRHDVKEAVGSGDAEASLDGVLEFPNGATLDVRCARQGDPPDARGWCLLMLQTLEPRSGGR